jgi:hypothetical protein
LQANLPYVGDCWPCVDGGPALTASLDRVASGRLVFARDSSFVRLLERWPD